MKLKLMERLQLLQILPKEGNFVMLKIVNSLLEAVSISEEDFKEFEIKQVDKQLSWNSKGNEEREIVIGEKATDIIVESLKKINSDNKLNNNLMSLYEKFIEGGK